MKNDFVENLKKFNRKERFYLVGLALGNKKFTISQEFTDVLSDRFNNENIDFSDAQFVAMDYHLDWIYARLVLSSGKPPIAKFVQDICLFTRDEEQKCITATQQDVDLLLAFGDKLDPELIHLLMLEAKGATRWTNSQLADKADRLGAIFGHNGEKWKYIAKPHFAVMSPKPPSHRLTLDGFPEFMAPNGQLLWIKMPMPKDLQKVTRCDAVGTNDQHGDFWKVEPQQKGQSPHDTVQ
jgi:hypothetical protein